MDGGMTEQDIISSFIEKGYNFLPLAWEHLQPLQIGILAKGSHSNILYQQAALGHSCSISMLAITTSIL